MFSVILNVLRHSRAGGNPPFQQVDPAGPRPTTYNKAAPHTQARTKAKPGVTKTGWSDGSAGGTPAISHSECRQFHISVIPAKAGIQNPHQQCGIRSQIYPDPDSRRNDGRFDDTA